MAGKYKIVMVRHGESEWNQKNLFCGWFDANLSEKGIDLLPIECDGKILQSWNNCYIQGKEEAAAAGKAVKEAGLKFDVAHTSLLTRAQVTLGAILKESGQEGIPIQKTWRLNERHYGGLTGLNKAETAAKYGEDQVYRSDGSPVSLIINYLYFRSKSGVVVSILHHQPWRKIISITIPL